MRIGLAKQRVPYKYAKEKQIEIDEIYDLSNPRCLFFHSDNINT